MNQKFVRIVAIVLAVMMVVTTFSMAAIYIL